MLNKNQYIFCFLVQFVFIACKSSTKTNQSTCDNASIQILAFDSLQKLPVQDFKIYEVTNYAEGITERLNTVTQKYIYVDSAGSICIPLNTSQNFNIKRKFVFVKEGYVYDLFYFPNELKDTILPVLRVSNTNR